MGNLLKENWEDKSEKILQLKTTSHTCLKNKGFSFFSPN